MKKRNDFMIYFAIVLLIIVIVFLIMSFFHKKNCVLDVKKIPAFLKVSNYSGFNLTGNFLNFGTLSLGSFSTRKINLNNLYDFPIKLEISSEGNISNYLSFNKTLFLEKGELKEISIKSFVVPNSSLGIYSGNVSISMNRCI